MFDIWKRIIVANGVINFDKSEIKYDYEPQ